MLFIKYSPNQIFNEITIFILKNKVLKRKQSSDIAPMGNALVQHVKVRNLMKDD